MTESQVPTPCALCGNPSQDMHHMLPRGRHPELVDDPENQAPVCRPCHGRLEPEGSWRLTRADGVYTVLNIQTGEVVCRRPVEGDQTKAVELLYAVTEVTDYRDKDRRLVELVARASDEDVARMYEWGGRSKRQGSAVQMVSLYELYMRRPIKTGWAKDLAEQFGRAVVTVYEDVRAAELYVNDEGAPMDASWYRVACHASDPVKALAIGREISERGGSVSDFRKELGYSQGEWETCSLNYRHRIKKGD